MVEPALHGLGEVCLFLLLCSDFVIVPGRGGDFLQSGLRQVIRPAYGACPGDLFVSFFRIVSAFSAFPHKILSFFCFEAYYYAVSRKNFFRISFGFFCCCFMFLYKTFWNLYKTKYFLYKYRGNSSMFFLDFRDLFMRIADFFAFFSWLFRWKNPFFLTRPSVNDRIYSYRPYIFHAFFGWFDKFFSFFSRAFLHFSVRLRKKSAAFSSGSSVFWDFFASSE